MPSPGAARLPFLGLVEQLGAEAAESEVPTALLLLMRKHRLVRHTSTCEWALSPTWKQRLLALWKGVDRAVRERFPAPRTSSDPFVGAAGIDTWYLNRIDPAGLPLTLRHALDAFQGQATEDEKEVDTGWLYDEAPLQMYRAGVSSQQGGGVSWSYILRNPSLALLIRRSPLGGIVAQARLGSECLWRLTPRRALDELDALVRRMWARPLPFRRKAQQTKTDTARWQVSQVHLAVDVANLPLEEEQLGRYVSRSRRQAIFHAAKSEIEQFLRSVHGEEHLEDEVLPLVMDWDALYADDGFSVFDEFGLSADAGGTGTAADNEPEPVEERAATRYRFGTRLSGVTFSPGGDISMVLYDKVLQGRLSGKRHMEPIWMGSGWQVGVPVTRHEARLRRPALRELGLPNDLQACLDDPWEFLTHIKDVFGAIVGRSEPCPDAVDVAWIRRVVPEEGDTHRSRWPTDPTWRVVQRATFAEAPAEARRLIRRRQQGNDVKVLDRGQYGYLVSRVAIRHPNGGEWTLSRALGEALPALERLEAKQGKDFGELVRERRRQRGLPLPVVDKVLPLRAFPRADTDDRHDTDACDTTIALPSHEEGRGVHGGVTTPTTDPEDPAASAVQASQSAQTAQTAQTAEGAVPHHRSAHAAGRVADAWQCLATAEQHSASPRVLDQLEAAYLVELAIYSAAAARAAACLPDAPLPDAHLPETS